MMKINRTQIALSAALVAVNVILFNLIVAGFPGLRVDLTDGQVFSLSPTTERILDNLVEPLEIIAFVSAKEDMSEGVRPLVPEVLDLLDEYVIQGEGKVRLRRIIPEEDEQIEEEARRDHGIRPQLGIYQDARQQGIQSFYLSLVIKYPGSDAVTLNADEMMTQNIFTSEQNLELKNVELQLTKAVKKAVLGFESKRNLFRKFPSELTLTTFISPAEKLPESLREVPKRIQTLLDGIAEKSEGKVIYRRGDLSDDEALDRYRVPALTIEGISEPFYVAMIVQMEGQFARLPIIDVEGVRSNAWIEDQIMAQVRRSSPGLLRRIGVAEHIPNPDGRQRQTDRETPPPPFISLVRALGREYDIVNLDLGRLEALPADLDLLLVMEPSKIDERSAYVIDQYVMSGGRAIFCLDRTDSSLLNRPKEGADARDTGLEDLLSGWGVELKEGVLLDPQCGGMFQDRGRGLRPLEGPWYSLAEVGFEEGGVNRDVDFMKSFEAARFWFPGALELHEVEGLENRWLLKSGEQAWLRPAQSPVEPDLARYPESGFAPPGKDAKRGRRILAASVEGRFPSHWAGREAPAARTPREEESETDEESSLIETPLAASRPTRIVVIANGEFLDFVQAEYARQIGPKASLFPSNLTFLQNAIDWLLEDDDLASIRNRGRSFRPLEKLDDDEMDRSMLWNFLSPLAVLAVLGIILYARRRMRRPLISGENR